MDQPTADPSTDTTTTGTNTNFLARDDDLPIPDNVIDCLAEVQLTSFAATPTTVQPFGTGALLRWSVGLPPGCALGLRLNGQSVGRSGSLQVQPATTTRYTLSAHAGRASRTLSSVTVQVDTSACVSATVPESVISSQIQQAVATLDQEDDRFSQRSDPSVEVTAEGIHAVLRLKLKIDNFVDPNLGVDFLIGLRVRNGTAEPFYRRFAVDVDWPWWVTTITAGTSKLVEEFVNGEVDKTLRPGILDRLREQVDDLVDQIPGDMRLHTLRLTEHEIRVTVCPAGEQTPFIVITPSDRSSTTRWAEPSGPPSSSFHHE